MSSTMGLRSLVVLARHAFPCAGVILGLVVAGCGSPAPAPAVAPTMPADIEPVWTVDGDSSDPSQTEWTYFNDPGARTLAAGDLFVAWSCSGNGRLEITPSRVEGHGGMRPTIGQRTLTFQIACPTDPDPSIYTWKPVSGQMLGGENVVLIRSAIEPSGPMRWTVVFAQR